MIDWTSIINTFIATLPLTITAIAGLIVAVVNLRKTEQVHIATNSMKDALVAAAKVEGRAQGVKEEKSRQARKP